MFSHTHNEFVLVTGASNAEENTDIIEEIKI